MRTFEELRQQELGIVKFLESAYQDYYKKNSGNLNQFDMENAKRIADGWAKRLEHIDEFVMMIIGQETLHIINKIKTLALGSTRTKFLNALNDPSYYTSNNILGIQKEDVACFQNGPDDNAINCFIRNINYNFGTNIPTLSKWKELVEQYCEITNDNSQELDKYTKAQIIVEYWEAARYMFFDSYLSSQMRNPEVLLPENEEYQNAKATLASRHHK